MTAEMNAGEQAIEWLYTEQLRVDREWSVRGSRGFTWWADRNAQTIEVIAEETGPEGQKGYLVSVRTELLRSVELHAHALDVINTLLMPFASMAGPVYDADTGTLSLCSLARIYDWIAPWMNRLISVAAVLQIGEARIMAAQVADAIGAEPAFSGHPVNGERPAPDEMAWIIATLIAPEGKRALPWTASEFRGALKHFTDGLSRAARGPRLMARFPCGDTTSSCLLTGEQPHPRHGNGLLVLQSFPASDLSGTAGIELALALNGEELRRTPTGYGFGSYVYRDDSIHFTSFIPNVACLPGLLQNIVHSCAHRARTMSARLGVHACASGGVGDPGAA